MSSPLNSAIVQNNNYIRADALQPGQWVLFLDDGGQLLPKSPGPYKVINREDVWMDPCRCFLMNINGKLFDYCPRMCSLDLEDLPGRYKVKVVKEEMMTKVLGEKMKTIQEMAAELLKKLAFDHTKYFGNGFDPDGTDQKLSAAEIQEKATA